MRNWLITFVLLLLMCCREDNNQNTQKANHNADWETTVNWVKRYFIKNNWVYPINIDTCDTCFIAEYNMAPIVNEKYNIAIEAFNRLAPKLKFDSTTGYRLTNAKVYKDSGNIYYSVYVEVNKNNIERIKDSEMWMLIDSNRILVTVSCAVFKYKNSKLSFVRWTD